LVRLFSEAANEGLRPVVTEIARLAASLSLLSIIPDEDMEQTDSPASLKATDPGAYLIALPIIALLWIRPPRTFVWVGNFGLNSFSQ